MNKRSCCMRFSSGLCGENYESCLTFGSLFINDSHRSHCPESLLDICAKVVAYHIPFQRIEERYERIPEPVQTRIIFWSFPRNERDICMYSSLANDCVLEWINSDHQKIPFYKGLRLYESGCVDNVLQVGFHLSGVVIVKCGNGSIGSGGFGEIEKRYRVSITFDRCKITSVTCTCDTKDIFWCQHVVALTLYRIRNASLVKLRVPISETLLQLDRQQLQKLLQYLISEHHTEVLPTAQRLADEILQSQSSINRIAGAPDPTAGSSAEDEHSWHLDEEQVSEQVKSYLAQGSTYYNSNKPLNALFAKVKEMLRAKDSNAARMLRLITEQFLADPRLPTWRVQGAPMADKCRPLWDQLGSLWVCVVLNPHALPVERYHWRSLLEKWSKSSVCPLEDSVIRTSGSSSLKRRFSILEESSEDEDEESDRAKRLPSHGSSPSNLPRTIFHRALEASHLVWTDSHLKFILENDVSTNPSASNDPLLFTQQGYPLWNESIPTACARVEALRCHGYRTESLRLAVAVVRTMKRQQREWQRKWQNEQDIGTSEYTNSGISSNPIHCNSEGWLGNPLDPIGSLFDTLAEASLNPGSKPLDFYYGAFLNECNSSSSTNVNNNNHVHEDGVINTLSGASNRDRPRYQHVLVPGSNNRNETYLSLAVEAALIGLGQQRLMPISLYAQEKACKQEEQLIAKLQDIDSDSVLISVFSKQAMLLLEGGPFSGLGCGIHAESVPMHNFAKYLFNTLLPYQPDLAYSIGLRAMRLPILENVENHDDNSQIGIGIGIQNGSLGRYSRWCMLGHIEMQQCSLATTMLCAAKSDILRLRTVLKSAQRNIHSYNHLFKLAQDALAIAAPLDGRPRHSSLLSAAFELGLQVLRMTLTTLNWKRREMVKWMINCATEVGIDALISIMHNWYSLFTPVEATAPVANTIMSPATVMKLGLDFSQQEELSNCARTLALQCSTKDPPNCALPSLQLCENDPYAFEAAYQIVLNAGSSGIMNSNQLFQVARYMHQRGYPPRAYKLALLALKSVHISYNGDNHQLLNEIIWAFDLALSLGKSELSGLIPIVVKNIQCASILTDIIRTCTIGTTPGISTCMDSKRRCFKPLPLDKSPLRQLLDAAIAAYVNTTHSRLTHISPRHYGDFIEFLGKARDTFLLAPDGLMQFASLIDNMKMVYKGKKKLMYLVKERFG